MNGLTTSFFERFEGVSKHLFWTKNNRLDSLLSITCEYLRIRLAKTCVFGLGRCLNVGQCPIDGISLPPPEPAFFNGVCNLRQEIPRKARDGMRFAVNWA